jgi:hypothetical protein
LESIMSSDTKRDAVYMERECTIYSIFKSGSRCYNIDVVATLFLNNFYPCYPIP